MSNVDLQDQTEYSRHIPVLLNTFLENLEPISGVWIDGTFGDGGYSRALLDTKISNLIAIDRDPNVNKTAETWTSKYPSRFQFTLGEFSKLDVIANNQGFESVDGIILDLGVSSMQIDQAQRGFSFQKKGPLDMRMSGAGVSAYDIVNDYAENDLANIIYTFGEERLSRRIASAIVRERSKSLIDSTDKLASVITKCIRSPKYGKIHPATKTFQALRIYINNELQELIDGLEAAERILSPNGMLAVITFHSLEDRIVKRFIQLRSGDSPKGNRYQPLQPQEVASFQKVTKKALVAKDIEIRVNPRARSAKLRIAKKIKFNSSLIKRELLGLPFLNLEATNK